MVKVQIGKSTIYGKVNDGIESFKGIPYAYPPIGTRRFKHSQLLNIEDQEIEASTFKTIPPQPDNKLETFFSSKHSDFTQNEDCLYLNIWRQNHNNNKKPVIIYFYGGGFVNGHGSAELYTPEPIVQEHDVIVITFNYRLGALGFLDWSAFNAQFDYNNGLSDQINVLKWVHYYIEYFGGDPTNITLMGQSAGSMSIQALMQQPNLDAYYHKVVLLSGMLNLDTPHASHLKAHHFAALMNHHYPHTTLKDLSSKDMLKLMALDEQSRGPSKGLELIYSPVKDEVMNRPLSHFGKPLVIGYTKDEGDCYIRNEARKLNAKRFVEVMKLNHIDVVEADVQTGRQQADIVTDYYFIAPMMSFFNRLEHNSNQWLLRFDWSLPGHPHFASAYHILDLIFWFGKMKILNAHDVEDVISEMRLSKQMISDLVYFAKTSSMPWSPYSTINKHPHIYK